MKDKYFTMTLEMWNKEVSKELPKKGSLSTSECKIQASILNGLYAAAPNSPFNPLLQLEGELPDITYTRN